MQSYIQNGWDGDLVDPDNPGGVATGEANLISESRPSQDWVDIRRAYTTAAEVPKFTNGQMVTYFVCQTVSDGLPAGDFKAINSKAKGLYDCGHIQNVEVSSTAERVWVRSDCIPEMKKNSIYKTIVSLSNVSYEIISAECGCKAGRGPKASCKHIGAMCYALVEFCKSGQIPDFLTCTDKLKQRNKWNVPKKVEIIPVDELDARRESILGKKEQASKLAKYNPIPSSLRQTNSVRLVENLRNDMLKFNPDCGLLQLLVPPVRIALHDHECTNLEASSHCPEEIELSDGPYILPFIQPVFNKETLNVTYEERDRIEEKTRYQSQSFIWHAERARRITGSRCGKILSQNKKQMLCSLAYFIRNT